MDVHQKIREALEVVLEHYMPEEEDHYNEMLKGNEPLDVGEPTSNHIYHSLMTIRQWLDAHPDQPKD